VTTKERTAEAGHSRSARAEHGHAHDEHDKHRKHHKHRHKRRKHPATPPAQPHGTLGVTLPLAPTSPPAPSPAPPPSVGSPPITLAQAQRLLWRAGFGPTPGQAQALVGQPLEQVVFSLTRPSGAATLNGPEPVNEDGKPLEPTKAWGEDHCWWLDRMVRSDQQLVERMTFVLHDWFATSNNQVDSQPLMLEQNELLRSMALGKFDELFLAVTTNPAMLLFLNGTSNSKWDPNENYAREMMELFSLGADRGAYTEDDVREMARTLTGWRNNWSEALGDYDFRFDPSYHDTGKKTVFGQSGTWKYEDAVRLCVSHPLHPSFFVTKLWGYFIPSPPSEATLASLQGVYVSSEYSIRAVLEAILQHPDFYEGEELVSPPVVYNAGLLRAIGRPIDTTAWAWLSANAGQQLFYPPNVSGWDFSRWLDTSTARARWEMASFATAKSYSNPWPAKGQPEYAASEEPAAALESALSYWGEPRLSAESLACLTSFAETCLKEPLASWQKRPYHAMRQNALRMLIATSPDMQVS
jgi:uncharacterized protein (DUF1800 family)